jgi:hypothetical protein
VRIEDGAAWPDELDARISEDMLTVFATEPGARALAYLRKITFGRVLPPTASADMLRDLEGRRALVAIIDMRMADGREQRKRSAEQRAEPDERSGRGGRPSRRASAGRRISRTGPSASGG